MALGIWQSGAGLTYDGSNIFFATGNGVAAADELGTAPRLGRTPPNTLPMSVAKLAIDPSSGALSTVDFFTPSDWKAIDQSDQDFGSSGVALLPTGFSAGNVRRLAIALGKNAKGLHHECRFAGRLQDGIGRRLTATCKPSLFLDNRFSTAGAYRWMVATSTSLDQLAYHRAQVWHGY